MELRRVVIAGLGDSGVLTAIRLARHAEVVGISAKPALVSGQELGWRVSRPHEWARANWIPFDRFRGLDRVRTVHGTLIGLDLDAGAVLVRHDDGSTSAEKYDALVISTGVSNGFWRKPNLQSADEIGADLREAHDRVVKAASVIIVGGGAADGRQHREDLARQASRSLLPQRARHRRPPPSDLGASQAPTH
jgi:NADH dehydrogenase FAD-containing subunit